MTGLGGRSGLAARVAAVGRAPGPLAVRLAVSVLCVIWGSTWLVIREGLDDLPPLGSAAARFVVSAVAFAALAGPLGRLEGGGRAPRRLALVMGVLNFAVPYGIVYTCETVIPSGLTSVLWAVFPIAMAVTAHVMLPEERLGPRSWAGLGVGFSGVVLLFLTDLRDVGPHAVALGAVLLVSPVAAAVGNGIVKRDGRDVSSAALNRDGCVIGAVLLAAAAALLEREAAWTLTPEAAASVIYLALVGTVVTFGLYFWLLRHAPAHQLGLIAYVTPALALLLGWAVRDEPLGMHSLAGAVLVLSGVRMVTRGRTRRTAASVRRRG